MPSGPLPSGHPIESIHFNRNKDSKEKKKKKKEKKKLSNKIKSAPKIHKRTPKSRHQPSFPTKKDKSFTAKPGILKKNQRISTTIRKENRTHFPDKSHKRIFINVFFSSFFQNVNRRQSILKESRKIPLKSTTGGFKKNLTAHHRRNS